MSDKPDFEKEAYLLAIHIRWLHSNYEPLDDKDIKEIQKELKKNWEAGYRYAVANDWWQTQEHFYNKTTYATDGLTNLARDGYVPTDRNKT